MNNLEYAAASEIILPPGSTSADLQEAINNAASGDSIIISDDMQFTEAVTLSAGKEITLQSDAGNNWVLSQPNINTRHFLAAGTLILNNITLDGMSAPSENGGGGIDVNGGALAISEGVVIKNCYSAASGGGIHLISSTFTMNGGLIDSNTSGNYGGGIYMTDSDFTIINGIISQNSSSSSGGGIYLTASCSLLIKGGLISKNTSLASGGGIYTTSSSQVIIYEGIVSDNSASYGGGIYMTDASLDADACIINGNSASYGGGVFVRFSTYDDIVTSVNTSFSCNRADNAHLPPPDAEVLYPNIQFKSTTVTNHPLNNYDIGYMASPTIDVTVHITYDANGGTGACVGPILLPCDKDTVLSLEYTGISRHGYTFTEWNTTPEGSGDSYLQGDEIVVSNSLSLYAKWIANSYTVTYDANGGVGEYVDSAEYDSLYTVLSLKETGIKQVMHILTGWNTEPDGSGTSYEKGDTFIISGDVTLYALWKKITREELVIIILLSIAIKDMAIAHILNAEGKNLQYILGTSGEDPGEVTICDILAVNDNVQKTIRSVIRKEILLQLKMEDALRFYESEDE